MFSVGVDERFVEYSVPYTTFNHASLIETTFADIALVGRTEDKGSVTTIGDTIHAADEGVVIEV